MTAPTGNPFVHGAIVIVYLQNPREKIWGLLKILGPAGVVVQGLGLHSFDDWLRGLTARDEQRIQPSTAFFPLSRVEKILLDEEADGAPSLDAQCVARTGMGLREQLTGASAPQYLAEGAR